MLFLDVVCLIVALACPVWLLHCCSLDPRESQLQAEEERKKKEKLKFFLEISCLSQKSWFF
jgi:hypothetical protein